ncbi:uncharacterized protein Dvir_GJ25778 [Drosophila virilis]|uniref:Uncharacterized protein n=1 Tax=Drosophila virilis TaxID=7244 RepID=A0A0Q9W4H2_DROVI|nr:uncharacterized protein Dvir_GJ25778 [Drosophila virilis]
MASNKLGTVFNKLGQQLITLETEADLRVDWALGIAWQDLHPNIKPPTPAKVRNSPLNANQAT